MPIGLVCPTCDDKGLTFPTSVIMGVNFIAFWQLALLYDNVQAVQNGKIPHSSFNAMGFAVNS